MIGAKEQGPKPLCGYPLAYMRFAKVIHPIRTTVARQWHKNLEPKLKLICVVTAKRSVTWAANAHMKLAFERVEGSPHRRRFGSA